MSHNETSGHNDLDQLVFPFCAVLIGLILDEVNKRMNFLGIPDSVLQFGFALMASVFMNLCLPSQLVSTIDKRFSWMDLEPETVLTILLPPLIFESSFKINSHTFFAKLPFITALTISVYVFSFAIASALLLPVIYTTHRCTLTTVFLLVSILVATDPVAVVAMLEQYGAPHRLRILIEGESLLNDGLALTAYRILVEFLKLEKNPSYEIDYYSMAIGLFMCLIATPFLGFCIACFVSWAVSQLDSEKKKQTLIGFSVYGSFVFCERIHGSSALGLVFFGITLNYFKETMSPQTADMTLKLWQTLGYFANNVIFIFAGYVVGSEIFTDPTEPSMTKYLTIQRMDIYTLIEGLLVYPMPLFARVMAIIFFYNGTQLFSKKGTRQPPKSDFVILSYAGLRGALGLILAMELTKMEGLKKDKDCQTILLLTCAMTCACLVFQGMTFASVAQKEGTTKRSRYVKDTCHRLSRFLKKKMDHSLKVLRGANNWYLNGANWVVVTDTVKHCITHKSEQMKTETTGDEMDDEDIWEGREVADEERVRKKNETDAKVGLYGILLAKVHDSWARGAVSGSTSHVIVSLLEHGIDEGAITVNDIKEHLERVDRGIILKAITRAAYCVHNCFKRHSWMDFVGGMAGRPLFSENDKPNVLMNRSFEKWWIAQTVALVVYTCFLANYMFQSLENQKTNRHVVYLLYGMMLIMTALETVFMIHLENRRWKEDPANEANGRRPIWRLVMSREFIFSSLNCALIFFGFILTLVMQFVEDRVCLRVSETAECQGLKYTILVLTAISAVYRILRGIPLIVVILREHCLLKEEMTGRVRLAFLMYLIHLMKDTKFPRELFSEAAYKIVSKESRMFRRMIDAVMRNELREHTNELDLVSVIKTRQAVRMMSYELDVELRHLKNDGFMPDDAVEKWEEVVDDLRISADAILTAPEPCIEDWLERINWIRSMHSRNSDLLINLLVTKLSLAKHHEIQPGTQILLQGERLAYVKKGICKVIEAIDGHEHVHEFYVHQGEILGARNLLLLGKKGSPLPITCPRRRYEATTFCEVLFLEKDTMLEMLASPGNLYVEVARHTQIERMIAEVRHVHPSSDLCLANFEDELRTHGYASGTPILIKVPVDKVAIVGCWTELQAVKPLEALDKNYHVRGPAHIYVAPADDKSEAIVYMYSQRVEHNTLASVGTTPSVGTAEENSNYSIVQDVKNNKIRVRKHNKKMK